MNYLELSIKNVEDKCNELYKKIINEYNYDLVIFIAKGSYIIGKNLSIMNNVPLLEIYASRKGGKLKKIIKPLFKFIPKKILIKLRSKEMKSSYHENNDERSVFFDEKMFSKYINCKKILLVDDSIDSGNSMILTKKEIQAFFKNSELKLAVFNVMKKSMIRADYFLYEDMMICGPWSNDSKENRKHDKMYKEWKRGN